MDVIELLVQAHSARQKLMEEVSRSDLRLRLLVGHANFYDAITLRLDNLQQSSSSAGTLSVPQEISQPSAPQCSSRRMEQSGGQS